MTPGRVIVINGPSSAGKSMTALALQGMLQPQPLLTGIDFFLAMAPRIGHMGIDAAARTNENGSDADAVLRWIFPDEPEGGIRIEVSEAGGRLVRGMHRAIAQLARAGNEVIFETVLLGRAWHDDLVEALAGLHATWVGVRCPLEVIEQRERDRGNRVIGQARGHYRIVHEGTRYDVEVDTSKLKPHEAAKRIADYLRA
jgi:chloramphenicol 3-O phosphotransferase